jgi:isoleucyl-tRNA synthetase
VGYEAHDPEIISWFSLGALQVFIFELLISVWLYLIIFNAILGAFRYIHPVNGNECSVVIGGDYITTESGTGLVHTAPGHGQEDYLTGLKYGLPIVSPVDDEGNFTAEAGQFNGLSVLGAGNAAVVKYLDEHVSLILEEPYSE